MFSKMKIIHSFVEDLHTLHRPMMSRFKELNRYSFAQSTASHDVTCPNCGRNGPMVAKEFQQFNFPHINKPMQQALTTYTLDRAYSLPEIHSEAMMDSDFTSGTVPHHFDYLQYNHQHTMVNSSHLEIYNHYLNVFSKSQFYDPDFIHAIYTKASFFKANGSLRVHPETTRTLNTFYCSECRDDIIVTLSQSALEELMRVKRYGRPFPSSVFYETVKTQDLTLLKQLYSLMAVSTAFTLSFGQNVRVSATSEMKRIESFLRFHKTIRPVTTL